MKTNIKKILLAEPRGFCAGVNRAIDIVDTVLEIYGAPIYVRHEIVHNHHVVNDFKNRGVIFVEDLKEVPDNALLVFSAHGTSPLVIEAAKQRGLKFIDAVCPLVTKVHLEIVSAIKRGHKVIYIGHRGHQEVLGAMGYGQEGIFLVESVADVEALKSTLQDQELTVATQTTLSLNDTKAIIEKLKETFSRIHFPKADDICYATQNRQDAVKELVTACDLILVIGSKNSSNTMRLLELAQKSAVEAVLVSDPEHFNSNAIDTNNKVIGISSGASAPESLVDTLISKLINDEDFIYSQARNRSEHEYSSLIETLVVKEEKVVFPMPVLA